MHFKGRLRWKRQQESTQPTAFLLLYGRVKRYKPLEEKVCGVNEKVGHEKVESG